MNIALDFFRNQITHGIINLIIIPNNDRCKKMQRTQNTTPGIEVDLWEAV